MMKRIIALILSFAMLFTGCSAPLNQDNQDESKPPEVLQQEINQYEETVMPSFTSLESDGLLEYIENTVYATLVDELDSDELFVEEVSTRYVSKEYLAESEYNSLQNIFFGYNISELDKEFLGTKYTFTLDEAGKTTVVPHEIIDDATYDKVIKNVAVGSGVILVSVSVALITKSPAASISAGKTVKLIFTISSIGAKAGTILALQSAAIAGTVSGFTEALITGDPEMIRESMMLAASEGFKFGAIGGAVKGIAAGIKTLGDIRYFHEGTAQATKYSEGVKFTKAADGQSYPRFEKWAIDTVKFDAPSVENALRKKCLTGNYYHDSSLANAKIGLKHTPAGYVWHHVEDMQTILLIPKDLHNIAIGGMPHKGGASLLERFFKTL